MVVKRFGGRAHAPGCAETRPSGRAAPCRAGELERFQLAEQRQVEDADRTDLGTPFDLGQQSDHLVAFRAREEPLDSRKQLEALLGPIWKSTGSRCLACRWPRRAGR